ncbi:unnamed protein product [Dovyalis caffra]|uniref:Uncharacterized protein n=1 Tax=Dovyalis caffra TaxID=77055 RepID=A0AAV1RJ69_9ROSI|nr:unnamed protein product [Dovyalis caffra]
MDSLFQTFPSFCIKSFRTAFLYCGDIRHALPPTVDEYWQPAADSGIVSLDRDMRFYVPCGLDGDLLRIHGPINGLVKNIMFHQNKIQMGPVTGKQEDKDIKQS